ncbi:PREDICTED: uncharacterized protein LOC109209314 [Nicotiana attenuata]|uniref:uncharacterized protein LOC109209314 n=1 Tax=Nicotiana attenuata TaxID=49451 RepID=UPI0009050B1C|nr:PREDICTED: uncharacterized protein LOC109209314 [Nicotiana attenuata]
MAINEEIGDSPFATSISTPTIELVDHNHPLYIHPSDAQGSVLTSTQLQGSENYSIWSRSMKIVLHGKNKLGFVLGSCRKSRYDPSLHELWDRCNAIVLAWIMNTVSPSLISYVIYASDAHTVCEDLKERFDKDNASRACYFHKEIAILTQGISFVSETRRTLPDTKAISIPHCLNESFENAKNQVFMTRPLPNLNQAYAMIVNIESHRISGKGAYAESNEVAMMSNKMYTGGYNGGGQSNAISNNSNGSYKPRNTAGKSTVWCDYCKYKGHTRENCFKLHGYPYDFKNKRRGGAPHAQANSAVNSSCSEPQVQGQHVTTTPAPAHFFTQEQYQQILHLLNEDKKIIDTGATNHMVHSLNLLETYDKIPENARSKVHLPTGEQVSITHVGICSFFKNKKVQNILHIPEFKYNLLSVSKLTKELMCLAAFYPDFCVFRELSSGKVLGIGKEELGLYILKADDRQNGTVERKHMSILDMARALRFQAHLPLRFWGECVSTAVYLLNRLPTTVLQGKSPFDKLFQMSPSLQHLRVFESLCYATKVRKGDKFCPKAIPAMHMGYSSSQKGYILYDLCSKRFFVSRDTVFKEEVFPFKHMSSGASPFFPVLELVEHPTHSAVVPNTTPSLAGSPILNNADVAAPSSASLSLFCPHQKSSRLTKPHVWLADYVIPSNKSACSYPMINHVAYDNLSPSYKSSLTAFSAIVEPKSFAEANQDPKWIEAIKVEITALEENNTWSIVPLPPEKVPIGCKWVFKVKYKSSGEVERYKARLVAKGYSQQEGLGYTGTFSPVAKMVTVRAIVALAVASGWYVFQMVVHNDFIQRDLLEEVYMYVPDGFSSQGECHKKIASDLVVILVYVDDLLVTGSDLTLIKQVRKRLQERFKMKDLGELKYFFGIDFSRSQEGIVMCQMKYALELVSELGLAGGKPAATPLEFNHKLTSIEFDK